MTTRRRAPKDIGEYSWLLHNGDQANQGEAAGLDTATADVRPMGSSATQLFLGWFVETMTGDGTKKVRVQLPEEVEAEFWSNDSNPNDVAADDIGSEVYAKDAKTVSTLATGRSKAGIVLDFDSDNNRVLVYGGVKHSGATGAGGVAHSVADRTALAAIAAASRYDGMVVTVRSDHSQWQFDASASFTSDEQQQIGVTPGAGSGRWVRMHLTKLKLAVDHTLADAAVLCTVPAGFALRLTGMPFWDVVTGFTGGTNAAIGVSASAIASTKGDLLGGAAGELTAVLGTAGIKAGTIGPKIDTLVELQAFFLKAADFVRFDKIADTYAAGAGFVVIPCVLHYVG